MHQYTGDLAGQMVQAGHEVHVVTTAQVPRDRYMAAITLHTPVRQQSTGFGTDGLQGHGLWRVRQHVIALHPDVVHFSGVHLWNPLLVVALRQQGIQVVHTLHDLDPHPDVAHRSLIRLWNRSVIGATPRLLVHGNCYRRRLLERGRPPQTVLATPLLHSFLAAKRHACLDQAMPKVNYAPWALFFGRFEPYKGLDVLLVAQTILAAWRSDAQLVLAGSGDLEAIWPRPLPSGVRVVNRRVDDAEGEQLFRECGVVVLPYTGATQSALPAAAYVFGKPVIVTCSGALDEVVQTGVTGWVVPPGDPKALVACLDEALSEPAHLRCAGLAGRQWYEVERIRQRETLQNFYVGLL